MVCPKCGGVSPDDRRFCSRCGASLQPAAPYQQPQMQPTQPPQQYQYQQPVQQQYQPPVQQQYQPQPQYQPPQQYAFGASTSPQPSLAKAIVSIALSSVTIIMSVISLICCIEFAGMSDGLVGIVFCIYMGIFIIPMAIVGLCLGSSYLRRGATRLRGMAKAGKILGIISLALLGFAFFLSLLFV